MDASTELLIELGRGLKNKDWKITLAESCTGGLVAQMVTEIPGSSGWFDRGFVTYSNQSKIEMLHVNPLTLAQYGAVSEQTALEMAQGALQYSDADIAGSITGVAGPDGGTPEKPVGMVCFAWACRHKPSRVATHYFQGTRAQVRMQAAQRMLTELKTLVSD